MNKYGISIMPCTPIFYSGPINLTTVAGPVNLTTVERLRVIYWNAELTGPEVDIGEQDIMDNPYLFTCRPVNLSRLTGPEQK